MGVISVSLPSDGSTADVADVNTPITTIVTEFNGNIDNNNIKSGAAIATSKLAADNGIGAGYLSSSAITLGYAQTTASTSTASTTAVQVSGLSVSVTIPSGGRRIKITAYGYDLANSTTGGSARLTIWDDTVGSGTQLQQFDVTSSTGGYGWGAVCIAVVTPAAGSKTYGVGLHATGGTATMTASTTSPAFILVEAI